MAYRDYVYIPKKLEDGYYRITKDLRKNYKIYGKGTIVKVTNYDGVLNDGIKYINVTDDCGHLMHFDAKNMEGDYSDELLSYFEKSEDIQYLESKLKEVEDQQNAIVEEKVKGNKLLKFSKKMEDSDGIYIGIGITTIILVITALVFLINKADSLGLNIWQCCGILLGILIGFPIAVSILIGLPYFIFFDKKIKTDARYRDTVIRKDDYTHKLENLENEPLGKIETEDTAEKLVSNQITDKEPLLLTMGVVEKEEYGVLSLFRTIAKKEPISAYYHKKNKKNRQKARKVYT